MQFGDQRKVAIVGAGAVGACSAYVMMISGLVSELVLVDINRDRAEGEAMDLAHSASFIKPIKIYVGEYEDCRDADIIVYSAGLSQKPGETRLDLVSSNLGILKEVLPKIIDREQDSILLMVTNPVDILTYAAIKLMELPPKRVIGSGTVLDSSRFRYLISDHCKVGAQNIHAYVIGEHGDTEVPVWSRANIAGFSVEDFCIRCGHPHMDIELISSKVRRAAYEVIARKGATFYAVGLAIRRICQSILRDENTILTVSGLLEDQYGIKDVCLSLPSVINRSGRERVLDLPIAKNEEEALHHSAETIKSIQQQVDLSPLEAPEETLSRKLPQNVEFPQFTGYH
ncbi:MAG TPA: L-lactate dehydrogenase [Desulfotomaculum sp.]|nr:MAG: L-lactate dehydrogenase [Desulfotomaculum sp. 46_296]KUK85428.1 MAG: L-lactate dehydrogenase [Desulfofundulus kuznetsovii]HAG10006.1 L-lactate dehydrogenase [Desulfotomaculum sp.]HBY03352.1 L-lactate dehydrogenase [Desulfotomaculum sp.]